MAKAKRKVLTQGAICHVEIPAPDLAKAKVFYEKVFGWKVTAPPGSSYWMFAAGEMSGGLDQDGKVADEGVMLYLKVADIPATLTKIAAAGGAIVKDKTEIGGGYGFYACFRDPNGNRLALWCRN
jgi:hypothetical protein